MTRLTNWLTFIHLTSQSEAYMSKEAAKTGLGPTVLVAIEQFFPKEQRGIEDETAFRILPPGMKAFTRLMRFRSIRDWMIRSSEKSIPGIWGGMICRKCYIDDKLRESLPQTEFIVNLGAGFDTRIFRLPSLSEIPVYEIDHEDNIQNKKRQLLKALGKLPSNLNLISLDFDHEDLSSALPPNGYSPEKKTFFIMEAVTQYLTQAGMQKSFDFLAKAATGSKLVFTYVRKDFLQGRKLYGWERAYKVYVTKNQIWLFGLDPEEWPEFLMQYGWKLTEDITYEELYNKYVPAGRELASTPVERIIFAEKI